jgi:hypothetical protein
MLADPGKAQGELCPTGRTIFDAENGGMRIGDALHDGKS